MKREDWMSDDGWRSAQRANRLTRDEQARRARQRDLAKALVPSIMMLGLFIAAHLALQWTSQAGT